MIKKFYLELEGESTITSKSIETPTCILDGLWEQNAEQIINSVTVDGDDREVLNVILNYLMEQVQLLNLL